MESWRPFPWKPALRFRKEGEYEEEIAVTHVYSRWHSEMSAIRFMVSHRTDGGNSEAVLLRQNAQSNCSKARGKFNLVLMFCNLMTFLNYGLPLKVCSLARCSMLNWVENSSVCDTAICQDRWKCSWALRIRFAFKTQCTTALRPSPMETDHYIVSGKSLKISLKMDRYMKSCISSLNSLTEGGYPTSLYPLQWLQGSAESLPCCLYLRDMG